MSELEKIILDARNAFTEKDYSTAVDIFRGATQLAPGDYRGYEGLGLALISAGNPKEAITALSKAANLNPNDADVHFGLGMAEAQLNHVADAIEHFSKAHSLRPDHIPIRESLILICLKHAEDLMDDGNVEWAKNMIDKAVEADPTSPDAAYASIRYHVKLGDYEQAKRMFRFIAEHRPDSPGLLEIKEEIGLAKQKDRGWLY